MSDTKLNVQLEGLFTILVGILFICLFPASSGNPVSLLGIRYFNEREARILQQRVLRDDPTKAHTRRNVSWAEIKSTVCLPSCHSTLLFLGKLTPQHQVHQQATAPPHLHDSPGYGPGQHPDGICSVAGGLIRV